MRPSGWLSDSTQRTERRLEMLNVTMQQIADALGLGLPLLVVDKTGLAGRYDAVLDFGPEGVSANAESSDEIGLPPTAIALEKQLGLKMIKQNAQVDALVIDQSKSCRKTDNTPWSIIGHLKRAPTDGGLRSPTHD